MNQLLNRYEFFCILLQEHVAKKELGIPIECQRFQLWEKQKNNTYRSNRMRLKWYGTYWIETLLLQISFWILNQLLAWMLYSLQFSLCFSLDVENFSDFYFWYIEFMSIIWTKLASGPTIQNWSFSWKFIAMERYDLHNLAVFSITLWCYIHDDF